jgi:hypothetical protein
MQMVNFASPLVTRQQKTDINALVAEKFLHSPYLKAD